jgi:hypothetical protein
MYMGTLGCLLGIQKTMATTLKVSAVALSLALALRAAVAARASSAPTSCTFTGRILISRIFLLRFLITRARTSGCRAYPRAQDGADGRDYGRDRSTHGYALGYCERAAGGDFSDESLYRGC